MKLRARWGGAYPDVGDVLVSGPRARSFYVIRKVKEIKPTRLALTVDRKPFGEFEDFAKRHLLSVCWEWKWDSRRCRLGKLP